MKNTTLRKLFYAAMLVVAGNATVNAQGTISTIAGTGLAGLSGDGGSALAAQFSYPSGVALDAAGNMYIADRSNNRVRKISAATGLVSTFAGSTFGGSGLGGPAALSLMEYPCGVFVNGAGDVLITDNFRDMTYEVDHVSGYIYANCGCGSQGNTGDGGSCLLAKMMVPAGACKDLAGNTYIADRGSNKIRKVDAATGIVTSIVNAVGGYGYTGDGGPGVSANMAGPSAVFFDPYSPGAGHLYISDAGNNVVRKLDLNTGIITTIAGTGVAGYYGNGVMAVIAQLRSPGNLFIDNNRFLYICDVGNNVVRRIDIGRDVIFTVAGNGAMGFAGDGGTSTFAKLNSPQGVWVDNTGNIYIADAGNHRIRKVTPSTSIGGSSPSTPKPLATVANSEVKVFPNPSTGNFSIAVGSDYANAAVSITNVIGIEVFATTMTGTQNDINLTGQPAGVYNVTVKSATGTQVQKITKE